MDLADDRFDVIYDPNEVNAEDLLGSIQALGYEPKLVTASKPESKPTATDQLDLAKLPEELATLFAQARQTGKPVLMQFSGPG